jgi:hypothetical protein
VLCLLKHGVYSLSVVSRGFKYSIGYLWMLCALSALVISNQWTSFSPFQWEAIQMETVH